MKKFNPLIDTDKRDAEGHSQYFRIGQSIRKAEKAKRKEVAKAHKERFFQRLQRA